MVSETLKLIDTIVDKIPTDPSVYKSRVIKQRAKQMLLKLADINGSKQDKWRYVEATSYAVGLKYMGVDVPEIVRAAFSGEHLELLDKWLEEIA